MTSRLEEMRQKNRSESDFQAVNVMLGLAMGEWAIFIAVALTSLQTVRNKNSC